MKRKVIRRFNRDLESVFEAYYASIFKMPKHTNFIKRDNTFINASFGASFKYNTNGGSVNICFYWKDNITFVETTFFSAQLAGARYKKYESDLYQLVYEVLQVKGELYKI